MNSKSRDILYYKNIIVTRINCRMYSNGWTIRELAEYSKLPYETVKKLVGGKINNPTMYTLIQISLAFKCGVDDLLEAKEGTGT